MKKRIYVFGCIPGRAFVNEIHDDPQVTFVKRLVDRKQTFSVYNIHSGFKVDKALDDIESVAFTG
jgi:hypothetical protein